MRVPAILMFAVILNFKALGQSGSRSSPDAAIPCSADAKWLNTNGNLNSSKGSQTPVPISLLVHVSKGNNCSNAEIHVTASFLSDTQEFICSGTIAQAMTMGSEVQSFNLEVRPFMQHDFLRWRNQPGIRGLQQGRRLNCFNLDGTADVGDTDRSKAAWPRLSIGVLPPGGGLSVVEALIRINPQEPHKPFPLGLPLRAFFEYCFLTQFA